jgi:hypothetical protein
MNLADSLTDHFTLGELVASSTALRLGVDNSPDNITQLHLLVLALALETVRELLGVPIRIDSGYRCPALNASVGGAQNSAHMTGYAADFVAPGFGTPLQIVQAIAASPIAFDQCIQEGNWVHFSVAPELRRELLTAHFGPGGTTYTKGIA